jgi:acrylyl-CoA reductase (NADPH)
MAVVDGEAIAEARLGQAARALTLGSQCIIESGVDRRQEALACRRIEAVQRGERRELRDVQDVVDVAATDARDDVLVAQARVKVPSVVARPHVLGKGGFAGLGSERGERSLIRPVEYPPSRSPLSPVLAYDDREVPESEAHHRAARTRRARWRLDVEPTRLAEVDQDAQRREIDDDVLRATRHRGDGQADELAVARPCGAQTRDPDRRDGGSGPSAEHDVEPLGERAHLRQLRHRFDRTSASVLDRLLFPCYDRPVASWRAWQVAAKGEPAQLVTVDAESIEPGEVEIAVAYSTINYKDGLALTASAPIIRRFPLICGVDLAGEVVSSSDPHFAPGDAVVATGFGLGEELNGGLSTRARVPASVCVALPSPLDARRAMAIGTAGLAAVLSVFAIETDLGDTEPDLPVLVTGATGGVGSLGVALLAARGYRVVASTGKPSARDFLVRLGATEVIDRAELEADRSPALGHARYSAALDVVGGSTLATVLSELAPGGVAAVSGLTGGAELHTTMYPFILRGVSIRGVNAVRPERDQLERAWARLASDLPIALLDEIATVVPLQEAGSVARAILDGRIRGRVVVEIDED